MLCFVFVRLPLGGVFVGLIVLFIWLALPKTETVSEGEVVGQVADEGILSAFAEPEVQLSDDPENVGEDLKDVVEQAVDGAAEEAAEDADAPTVVEEQIAEIAPGPVTDAVVSIVADSQEATEEAISQVAPMVRPEDASEAAEKIVDGTLRQLDLDPGTLDQEDEVSDAISESLAGSGPQQVIQGLGLTAEQETQIEEAATRELTSSIVQSRANATTIIVEELSVFVREALSREVTRWFVEIADFGGASGLGFSLVNVIAIAIRHCPLKLNRRTDTNLRYATAVHCTIERMRLEKPKFLFLNEVREVTVRDRQFPFALQPSDGDLDISCGERRTKVDWNLRLLWFLVRYGECGRYFYAMHVNGHWYSLPITLDC